MESRRECRHLRFQSPTARQEKLQNCCNRIIFSLGYERLSGGRLTAKRTFVRQPATAGVLRSGDLCVFDDDGAVVFAAAVHCRPTPLFHGFASQLHIRKHLVKKKVKKLGVKFRPPHTSPSRVAARRAPHRQCPRHADCTARA
jgi:hypothetical protein